MAKVIRYKRGLLHTLFFTGFGEPQVKGEQYSSRFFNDLNLQTMKNFFGYILLASIAIFIIIFTTTFWGIISKIIVLVLAIIGLFAINEIVMKNRR